MQWHYTSIFVAYSLSRCNLLSSASTTLQERAYLFLEEGARFGKPCDQLVDGVFEGCVCHMPLHSHRRISSQTTLHCNNSWRHCSAWQSVTQDFKAANGSKAGCKLPWHMIQHPSKSCSQQPSEAGACPLCQNAVCSTTSW